MNLKFLKIGAVFFLVITLFFNFVNAFGVSSSYWKGNPVTIAPGETKIVELTLQNMIGSDDETVRAILIKGDSVASFEDQDYTIPIGTKDTKVQILITIPNDAEVGSKYEVIIGFSTGSGNQGGAVSLGTGVQTAFDVEVVGTPTLVPAEEGISKGLIVGILVVVALIIIAVIIWLVLRARKARVNQ